MLKSMRRHFSLFAISTFNTDYILTKAETFVILKGKVRVSTYNDDGEVLESCVISQESGTYVVDIPKNVWHGLECLEPSVLLECKEGPFVEHEVDGILEIKK